MLLRFRAWLILLDSSLPQAVQHRIDERSSRQISKISSSSRKYIFFDDSSTADDFDHLHSIFSADFNFTDFSFSFVYLYLLCAHTLTRRERVDISTCMES